MINWAKDFLEHWDNEVWIIDELGAIHFTNQSARLLLKKSIGSGPLNIKDLPIMLDQGVLINSIIANADFSIGHYSGTIKNANNDDLAGKFTIGRMNQTGDKRFYSIRLEKDKTGMTHTDDTGVPFSPVPWENLQLLEHRIYFLLEAMRDAVFLKDGEGRWQITNAAAKKLFRLENIDWQNKTDLELASLNETLRDAHLFCIQTDESAWNNGYTTLSEETSYDLEGNLVTYEVVKEPVFNDDGSRKGLVIVARDITSRRYAEKELTINNQAQEQINKILKASLENTSLKEFLDEVLQITITSPFIDLKQQGGIFLTDKSGGNLVLTSEANFNPEIKELCCNVPFGKCICGRAASQRDTIFVNSVDDRHDINYPGMPQHGHYAVPIIYQGDILGVLIVYLNEGHHFNENEVKFLEAVTNIIAGTVYRKRAQEQEEATLRYLEDMDRFNTILIRTGGTTNLPEILRELLEAMLPAFDADRTWLISPCDPGAATWKLAMECRTSEPGTANNSNLEFETSAEDRLLFAHALQAQQPFLYNEKEGQFSRSAIFKQQESAATMFIVLNPPKGKPWLLGIEQHHQRPKWRKEHKNLLRQIAIKTADCINSYLLLDELRIKEAKYHSLTETAQDIIATCDLRGNFHYLNNKGLEFFELDVSSCAARSVFDYIPQNEKEAILNKFVEWRNANTNRGVFEVGIYDSTGTTVPFEVNSSFAELEDGSIGLVSILRDITERRRTEKKLLEQNQQLQIINTELDKFVYRTSHDLRAPLTSVLGLIDIIKESVTSPEELTSFMEMIEKSIYRLDGVIKNIIDYSKSNRLMPKAELINVEHLYCDTIESISFIKGAGALEHLSEFKVHCPFISDKAAVSTIVSNLVSNAVKYRRSGVKSYVDFRFSCNEQEAVIVVEDNGEGIPAEKHDLVFDMFYRNSVSSEGSGLGLYIVKQNVQKLGGTIQLTSVPDEGSTFKIILPNLSQPSLVNN